MSRSGDVRMDMERSSSPEQRRMEQTQAQVNEVVGIMKSNVAKVMERDQKLNELDLRADALQAGAAQFQQSSTSLRRKFWWQNIKMMIILGAVIAILIIVIALSIGLGSGSSD
jgi:uncharacterized membrane protein YidH (DUF202 family)